MGGRQERDREEVRRRWWAVHTKAPTQRKRPLLSTRTVRSEISPGFLIVRPSLPVVSREQIWRGVELRNCWERKQDHSFESWGTLSLLLGPGWSKSRTSRFWRHPESCLMSLSLFCNSWLLSSTYFIGLVSLTSSSSSSFSPPLTQGEATRERAISELISDYSPCLFYSLSKFCFLLRTPPSSIW